MNAKLGIARSLTTKILNGFNVDVSAVDNKELRQRLVLGVVADATHTKYVSEIQSQVIIFVEETQGDLKLLDCRTVIIPGL